MKIKSLIGVLLVGAMLFAGCTPKADPEMEFITPPQEVDEFTQPDIAENANEVVPTRAEIAEALVASATQNQYPELEVTAAILERKAILPGASVRVHVSVKNTGDKAIAYIQGSSSADVPDALYFLVPDLQPVPSEKQLGAMLMDYRTNVIEPGAEEKFVLDLLLIESVDDFDSLARQFQQEQGSYIGNADAETISEKYEGITAAKSGEYTGQVYFFYSVVDDAENLAGTEVPSGYQLAEVKINVQ